MKKKALISSILTIAVCVSLIAGATFALFTDREDVNIAVTAGNVDMVATIPETDVKLYSAVADENGTMIDENGFKYRYDDRTKDGKFANGGYYTIVENTISLINVTPGDKVEFKIDIENESNVTVNWRTVVWVIDDDGLWSGLNVAIGNDTAYNGNTVYSNWAVLEPDQNPDDVPVSIALPITAGNEYEGKTCKIGYRVEAVQGNAVTKNPYNQIDRFNYEINSEEGMMLIPQILNSFTKGELGEWQHVKFTLTADMDMSKFEELSKKTREAIVPWTPISSMYVDVDGGNHTVSNLKCGTNDHGQSGFFSYAGACSLKNITLKDVEAAGSQAGIVAGRGEGLTMENVTIAGTNYVTYNPDANLEETWGGVGAVIGVASDVRAADKTVTIAKDATVTVNHNGVVTEAKYNDGGMAYVQNINAFVDKQGTVTEIGEKSSLTTVSSVAELRAAINNASTDDKCTTVIRVAENTHDNIGSVIVIEDKNIVIKGMGNVVFTSSATDNAFNVRQNANVTFENIELIGNGADKNGIYVRYNSTATLKDCKISGTKSYDVIIDEASDKKVNTTSTVHLFSTTVEDVAMCAFPMVETHVYADVKGDSYVEFNYDANSKVGYIEKQNINKKPENMWINGDNSDPVGVIFFVKGEDNEARNEALKNALDTIQSDSKCWNKPVFVKLAAGEYAGNYVINQYPKWNGIIGAGNSGNNYASGVPTENVTTENPRTYITFIGETASTYSLSNTLPRPLVSFTGNVTVNGFGNAGTYFKSEKDKVDANATTMFQNVIFNAGGSGEANGKDKIVVYLQAAANNVTFDTCLFEEATHITVGGSGANAVGTVNFNGCTFDNGGCISGYVKTLNVTECTVVKADKGFINKQTAGAATVTGGTYNVGEYFLRTATDGSGVNLAVTDATITLYEASGTKHLVYFRGHDESAAFIDCTIPKGYTTHGVDANSLLTIKNYNTFKHNIPGVQIYVDGVTHEVVLDKVSAEAPATLKIPEGVTTLASGVFTGNTTIKEVTIPFSVKNYGGYLETSGTAGSGSAFKNSAVETIELPEGLTEIPVSAFEQAANLKSINIPASVTAIGIEAFAGSGLEKLTVPATITEIGYGAFRDMKSLTSVTIEGDVDIPIYAFRACASLENVVLKGKNVTFAGGTGRGMIFTNKQNGDGSGITIQVENEVIKARLMAADTAAKDYGGYTINCRMTSDIEEGSSAVEGLFKDKDTGALYAYNQTAYEAALSSDATEINVMPGTYTFKTTGLDSTKTIICAEGTVFEGGAQLAIGGATVVGATFTNDDGYLVNSTTINGTFKDCVFTNCDGLRYCYAGETVVFENCVFDTDFYGVHFDGGANDVVFKNCSFTGFNTFGGAVTKLTMENCTFKYNGKGGYNGLNLWGDTDLINCTFVFDGTAIEWVDLCNDNKTVTFTNCVVTDGKTEKDIKTVVGNYGLGNTIIVDGAYVVKHDDSTDGVEETAMIKAAVAKGATHIWLADGEYNIDGCGGKTLTISGSKDAILVVTGGEQGEANGQLDYGFDGSTVTFNGVTIKTNNQTYAGYARLTGIYNECAFINTYCLNNNSTFTNCTFDISGDQYNIWTWGAPEATFTNCTFNSDGKAILLYGTANTKLTVNGCTFNDKGGLTDLKAAIEIGNDYGKSYELIVNNTKVNGYEINDKGICTFTTLWANKNSMGTDKLKVTVDGVEVYGPNNTKSVYIDSAAGLFAFANEVNVKNNTYSGKTVYLTADIDLKNELWTPIGQTGATQFQGTFDGQGHTIKNLNIDSSDKTGAYYSTGLFGWLNAATVKNVNVDGATVKGNHNVGVIAGYLETAGCTVSNCNVSNATIVAKHADGDQCGDKVGVIVGHAGNTGVKVEKCSATTCTVTASRDAGQIVGAAKTENVVDCTATDVTVSDSGDCTGANLNNAIIGRVL